MPWIFIAVQLNEKIDLESRKDGRSKGSISLRGLWTVPARVSAHHSAWQRLFESERYGDVESAEGKE